MQTQRSMYAAAGAIVAAIVGGFYWQQSPTDVESQDYKPVIDPDNFVSEIDNRFFTLKPGSKFIYQKKTSRGVEWIEVTVAHDTKKIMGVTTIVVRDRVRLNKKLIEEVEDWYAQDKEGNVWYFGEAVNNYEDGKLRDHKGSWEAGVDGAKPGIIMPGHLKVGYTYRKEYYQGVAEDMGSVVAIGKTVTVAEKSFKNCVQIRDWSQIEKLTKEYKYYCPEIGFKVLEKSPRFGLFLLGAQRTELVSVTTE